MLLNIAPVDYERYLALYGITQVAVPPLDVITHPKRITEEPDALAARTRQPPAYEDKHPAGPGTHPIAGTWRQYESPAAAALHLQPPPDLPGAARLQEQLGHPPGILAKQVAGLYAPHPEPPPVSVEFMA